jgi:hypothetical protein
LGRTGYEGVWRDCDCVEGQRDHQFQHFEGRPQGVFDHKGQEYFPDGKNEEFGFLVPFNCNVQSVIGQSDDISPIQLHLHPVLQFCDNFIREVSVTDIDDDSAADVASERLHRHILDALDFAGYIHWEEQVHAFLVLLDEHLVGES